jgi:DNA-directed RNA polymerase subunit beta'
VPRGREGLRRFDEVVLALQAGEVELLTPDSCPLSGRSSTSPSQYNDQDIVHAEIVEVTNEMIETTVGRVIFNMHLPVEMPYINGLLKKKGLQELVNFCSSASATTSP